MLATNRLSWQIGCLDMVQEVYDYLKTVCGDLHVSKGDFDESNKYPDEEVRGCAWL